jgi:anti-sigma factor RsiW
MTHQGDPIGEADLHAYIDDQLSPERRIAVEDHLARSPELAARIMADLRVRDELRLATGEMTSAVTLKTADAARRLERGLTRDAFFVTVRRVAAAIVLIAIGWLAHVEFLAMGNWAGVASASMPAYVDEAGRAHQTALLRASMPSQPLQPNYDAEEISAAISIRMPTLPANWTVLDVQIFPSSTGPALEMAVDAEGLGTLSLFAVRPGSFDVAPVRTTSGNDVTAVYWQIGDAAYALVGAADGDLLKEAAKKLASPLY